MVKRVCEPCSPVREGKREREGKRDREREREREREKDKERGRYVQNFYF
jgi:hypothetical protein